MWTHTKFCEALASFKAMFSTTMTAKVGNPAVCVSVVVLALDKPAILTTSSGLRYEISDPADVSVEIHLERNTYGPFWRSVLLYDTMTEDCQIRY
jgi:hypothetical protein